MNDNNQKRISYIDAAKGIGIILVVIGHSITNSEKAMNSDLHYLLQFISQFHMAFFFMISGFVFNKKYFLNPVKSAMKKIKVYYIPFVVYNLIFVLLHNFLYKLYIFDTEYTNRELLNKVFSVLTLHIQEICGAMWFLRSLLTIIVIFIWIGFIANLLSKRLNEWIMLAIILLLFGFSFSKYCPHIFKINTAFYYLLFFYLGFLIRKNDLVEKTRKYKNIISLFGLVINLIFAANYVYAIGGACEGYQVIVRFIGQITGSLMIITIAENRFISENKVLNILGNKSLDIMALHFVCFKLVSIVIIQVYNLDRVHMGDIPVVFGIGGLWWIVYTIVGLAIPVLLRIGFDKVRNNLWYRMIRK